MERTRRCAAALAAAVLIAGTAVAVAPQTDLSGVWVRSTTAGEVRLEIEQQGDELTITRVTPRKTMAFTLSADGTVRPLGGEHGRSPASAAARWDGPDLVVRGRGQRAGGGAEATIRLSLDGADSLRMSLAFNRGSLRSRPQEVVFHRADR